MKKKNYIFAAAALVALAACSNEELVNGSPNGGEAIGDVPVSFNVKNQNMTRATTAMESNGHYNFGVWAYKQLNDGSYQTVMPDYLVGYQALSGTFKGYAGSPSTLGASGSLTDGVSQWFYEGLGNAEYKNTSDGFYKYDASAAVTTDAKYMSNNTNQYLKFWDYSAKQMEFYAYAPYINGTTPVVFTHNATTATIKFPTVTAGTEGSLNDYMVAAPVVRKPDDAGLKYNDDVPLTFTRFTSQVKLAFYEVIEGYDVEMIDLDATSTPKKEVAASGDIITSATDVVYDYKTGAIDWNDAAPATTEILFNKPEGNSVSADTYHNHGGYKQIANNKDRSAADNPLTKGCLKDPKSQSSTTYYCLPSSTNGDLTFHVSFKLHSLDTDEVIEVKDATVVIPAAYTRWNKNTVYTYIFKITKDANGSTGGTTAPKGLYPIVFDGIGVTDMATNESEWIISQVSMSKQMITLADGTSTTVDATLGYLEGTTPSNKNVEWTTSDADVVAITVPTANGEGKHINTASGSPLKASATITAVAAGKATVKATNVGTAGECIVAVPLELSDATLSLTKGGATGTITADNLGGSDGQDAVTWASSDEAIATVANGVVTPLSEAGTVTITAQYKGVKATCEVTVE